jgi:arylformamidase
VSWRDLGAEALELQFNPRRAVPDFEDYQAENARLSAAVRARLGGRLDVAYGEGPLQTLDVYPAVGASGAAPVHLFFHGGYWRAQDKANFAFVAGELVAAGICTLVVNYDLCPAVTLDGVVAAARRAVGWAWRHAGEVGGDPARITLSGSSAGAHLQAMVLAHDWASERLPADIVKGAVPITGIYDPEPARHISVNAEIGLTEEIARRNNALALAPRVRCPVALFVGGAEPPSWQQQTLDYAAHLRAHGLTPSCRVLPGANHFSILDQYLHADSEIVRAIVALAHGRPFAA